MRRKGEPPGGRHFRSDRFVMTNGAWYFSTREGIDVGPFPSRADAVKANDKLIVLLRGISDAGESSTTIKDFIRFQVRS